MNALALAAAVLLSQSPSSEGQVLLAPGAGVTLRHPGLTRVAVADPSVADVAVVGTAGELLVTGKRKGRTTLTLWTRGGKAQTREVVVDDGRAAELAAMLRETVNPELSVRSYGGKVVVDGRLDSMEEYHRLRKVLDGVPDVAVLVTLDPRVLRALATAINEAYDKAGLRTARAVPVGGKILLEGSVADDEELRKAQTIADSYYHGFSTAGR